MIANFFDRITRLSLRFRWVTIFLTVAVLAAGVYSATTLNLELLPSIEFPQTVVIAQWQDAADAQEFLSEVTVPLEEALSEVDGVVNVESTTTTSLGIIIVRNEFGQIQENILADIETAIDNVELPEGMERPETLNFGFSDLPVVIASVSSGDLTLSELKAVVQDDLQPRLEALPDVSEVNLSGGQQLPEEEGAAADADEEVAAAEPTATPEPTPQPTATAQPTATPAGPDPLPQLLVDGAQAMGLELATAEDITPDLMRQFLGMGPQATQILALLTPDNLRQLPPESIGLLPPDFVSTLDAELVAELDDLAAEFGGAGVLAAAELADAETGGEDTTVGTPDVPTVEPISLPDSWVEAAAGVGAELATTADVTADVMGGIAGFAPELLDELTPSMWRAIDPAAVAAALPALPDDFDAELLAQLQAIQAVANGTSVEAVDLPQSWVDAGAAAGFTLSTTADVSAEVMDGIAGLAPELLDDLTPAQILALTPAAQAALPADFVAELDAGLQETLAVINIRAAQYAAATETGADGGAETPTVEPIPLPDSWVEAAAGVGAELATTADVTADVMGGIAGFAPELLDELTPSMWRAIDPAAVAAALPALPDDFDAELLAQLQAIQAAANGTSVEAVDLPDSWVDAGAAAGFTLSTTADVSAEVMDGIAGLAPELLDDLTPAQILALTPAAQAALPADFVAELDAGLQETLAVINIRAAQYAAATETGADGGAETETGPSRLPQLLIDGVAQFGLELEFPSDLTPDIMRQFTSAGPQAAQIFSLLSDDNLRDLPPESIALLPPDFVETLDAELRAELDDLAAEFGGAGVLAAAEAEAADPARLPEALIQGAAQAGVEIEFAQDITPDFIRLFSGLGEQGVQALSLLTPDNLRLLDPEVIALLPAAYLDTLDAELRAELDELAAEYGGAGALALAEAEAAEAAAVGAPPLTGVWTEPGPDGEPPLFENAADILNNSFTGSAASFINFLPDSPNVEDPAQLLGDLSLEVITYLAENEEDFAANLNPSVIELLNAESILYLLDTYPEAFDADTAERLRGVAAGDIEVFVPEASVTRTNGNPSLIINVFKAGDANTVAVAEQIFDLFEEFEGDHEGITITLAFEQATFIEDSINGVSREGVLGAVFAVLVILIFLSGRVDGRYRLSWRSTIITGVSIPLSVFSAFLLMRWMPATLGVAMQNIAANSDSGFIQFIAQLFPSELTLNIMTLSGLTVAIGRVVDDSIVVMENIYRFIQQGDSPRDAAVKGTKEVAIAIFASTVTTMAVFLPLGLVGGIIGSVFMPFGLTVAWALAASFVVSITVVPVLALLLIRRENLPEHEETALQRFYTPVLEWCLNHRFISMAVATVIFLASLLLLAQLPQSFIPALGEPTINTSIELAPGTTMVETDALVQEYEMALAQFEDLDTIQSEVGSGGGIEAMFGGGNISQNVANVTITTENQDGINALTNQVRQTAESIFGEDNATVSAASQTGFSGFSIILTGESGEELATVVEDVRAAIGGVDVDGDGVPDIANVTSNLDQAALGGAEQIIRIDGRPAISFAGDLETTNTLGVTNAAKEAIQALDSLPEGVEVTEGFDSEQQVEGFRGMITAIGWSILIVYLIMALTFRSLIHPFTILFSLPFALVGAAIALFITNSVLGISAMIGLMMLVGIVVTNAIVLMELVQQLRARGAGAYEALVEGGRTRLRPILMTALTAILALIPLAVSTEAGALIASELARAVMGGLIVSTALTLVVVPIVYSMFDDLTGWVRRQMGRSNA